MNTKSLVARVAAFARSKKGAALLLLACTAGEGNGGLTWAMGAAGTGLFTAGVAGKTLYEGAAAASKTVVAKQNQSVSAVGGGSAGAK